MPKIGILLTNTGTPDAPTPKAVRRYLREFLSDKRVVQIPRVIWLPILYGLVLTLRPRRSAKLYEKIWTPAGSPMRVIMQKMAGLLQQKLETSSNINIGGVEIGMNYGQPSIQQGLDNLRKKGVDKIIILPLFPQYSNTTTASTFDRATHALKKWPTLLKLSIIRDYATHHDYIRTLASSIRHHWEKNGTSEHLLISFHGIPERFVQAGDPYAMQCEQTANLLADELKLPKEKWTLCYQSQFGYDKWLKPSTQVLFTELPKRSIKMIDIVCPGFSVDCLETLEEVLIKGKEIFHQAGGESFRYISALNDSQIHIDMLANLIMPHF